MGLSNDALRVNKYSLTFDPSRIVRKGMLNNEMGMGKCTQLIEQMLHTKLFPNYYCCELMFTNDGLRAVIRSDEPIDAQQLERALFGSSDSSSPLFN